MALLAQELQARQNKREGDADFSVLWSDVGPKFYNAVGWKPFESTYLELPTTTSETTTDTSLKLLKQEDLPPLLELDEKLLREKLSKPSNKVRAAVVPTLDQIKWHHHREDTMCNNIFSRTPTIRGAVYTPANNPNAKIWAIWTRSYYGGKEKPEKNKVHLIRLGIQDESVSDQILSDAIRAISTFIQKEASEWSCTKVEIWNPNERVKRAAENIKDLNAKYVVRENENLGSLQWFGDEPIDEVEWVANDKFAWC